MRRGYRLMALIFLLPVLGRGAESFKYFQQAGIDPVTHAFTGRHEATEEKCKKAVCARFAYNDQGKLQRVDWVLEGNFLFYDSDPSEKVIGGDNLQQIVFIPRSRLPITTVGEGLVSLAAVAEQRAFENNSIEQWQIRFDSRGRVLNLAYLDHFGKPAGDQYHHSSFVFTPDDQGRAAKVRDYNRNGGRMHLYESRLKYQQDGGRIVELESLYSVEPNLEKPVEGGEGVFRIQRTYDQDHNLIEERFYGLDRKLKANAETGSAINRYKYNEAGDVLEAGFFGADEKPKDSIPENAAMVKYKYDENGICAEKSYYDKTGELKKGKAGAAFELILLNHKDLTVERRYLDEKGRPVPSSKPAVKAAKLVQKFDNNANIIEEWYYGANDKPFAGYKAKYDGRGNLTEITFYAGDNKIFQPRDKGASTIRFRYDELDGVAEVTFYDARGSLVDRKDMKIAGIWIARDRRGFPVDTKFFDKDREIKKYRIEGYTPVAEIKMLFDTRGLTIQAKYLDQKGKPVLR